METVGSLEGDDPEARYRTVQILIGAGASTLSRFSSPFWQTSTLGLSALASMSGENLMVVGDLIKAGAEVEDEDLAHFQRLFDYDDNCFSHDRFEKIFVNGIISLLEALGTPEDPRSAGFQLFELTSRFAQTMKLEVLEKASNHYLTLAASQDAVHDFLENTIEVNDVGTLGKFIDSGRLEQVKSVRFPERDSNWTLVHTAVASRAVNCLKLLLKVGCTVDVVLSDGSTLAHLCWADKDEDSLRVLIEYQISTILQNVMSNTIWHLAAESNSTKILKLLLTLEGERNIALGLQSGEGRTPVCASLARGRKEALLILMQHCHLLNCWKSESYLFREAAAIGSAEVVRKLLDVGVALDPVDANSESPLHSIGLSASVECARLLVEVFPHCHLRTRDNRKIPLESFMTNVIEQGGRIDHDIFKILLTNVDLSNSEYGPHLWQNLCSAVVRELSGKADSTYKWKETCAYTIDNGAILAYEEAINTSALIPLATEVSLVIKTYGTSTMPINHKLPGSIASRISRLAFATRQWRVLSDIILHTETATSYWDGAAKDASLTQLLSQAVLQDDTRLIHCLLKHGVDPELRIDSAVSALELACCPGAAISENNFLRLLSAYKSSELVEIGTKIDILGLLYLPDDQSSWKLRRLLEAGLSCNHQPNGFTILPLNWHIYRGSNLCAEVLLDFGANPWQTDIYGSDAVFTAVGRSNVSILSRIATISCERNLSTNWNHKLRLVQHNGVLLGGNGLHLAAAWGHIECLRFYLDRDLLDNIEATDSSKETPMHYAARFGRSAVVAFLKDRGGNINAVAQGGVCPLHLAARGQHLQAVQILLSLGAEQKPCASGLTPLSYAYQTGNVALIQLLKANRENDSPGQNLSHPKALHAMATAFEITLNRNDIQACKDLVDQGSPVDIQLDKPWPVTPLMCAICTLKSPEIAEWLIDKGARVSTVFHEQRMPGFFTTLEAAAGNPMYNHLIPKLVAKYSEEKGDLLSLPRSPLSWAVRKNNHMGLLVLLDAISKEFVLPLER